MSTVKRTQENLKKCICMKCPSYTFMCKIKSMPENLMALMHDVEKADHMEGMFCAFGKSKCIEEQKGCLCAECEIFKENALEKGYFCI